MNWITRTAVCHGTRTRIVITTAGSILAREGREHGRINFDVFGARDSRPWVFHRSIFVSSSLFIRYAQLTSRDTVKDKICATSFSHSPIFNEANVAVIPIAIAYYFQYERSCSGKTILYWYDHYHRIFDLQFRPVRSLEFRSAHACSSS